MQRLLPIPRRYGRLGLRRYGSHGLSETFLLKKLTRKDAPAFPKSQLISAQLGNNDGRTTAEKLNRMIEASQKQLKFPKLSTD